MTENVKEGHFVQVDYTGTFPDGTVFDTSEGKQPLEVLAGKGMLIKGFDNALVGMAVGSEKEVDVEPADAYGERQDDLLRKVPRSEIGSDMTPEVGMMIGVKAPTGQVFPATITEVTDDEITIDANHPLAGKKLHFKLKVVATREPTEEDLKKFQPKEGCGCEDGDCGDKDCGDDCNC